MITQRRAFHYLLLFALLAGHWLYATHSHVDEAHNSNHHCQFCLHGVQFDAFLPVIPLKPPALTPQPFFIKPVLSNRSTPHNRFHDSRAPPRN